MTLRRLAVVALYDATELLSTSNDTFRLGYESLVQYLIVHAHPPMWAMGIIMPAPHRKDIVELVQTEAYEVVQGLSLCRFDPRFRKRICLWGLDRNEKASCAFGFPKQLEFAGVFSIAIMNHESRFDTHVIEPHVGVTGLLHDPIASRIERRRTAVDFAAAQVDKNVM